jgi:hypothetical protein
MTLSAEGTIRERILKLLLQSSRPLSAAEIATELGLDPRRAERDIYEHLRHLAKTVKRRVPGYRIYMVPPTCLSCGYVFSNLDKPRKPSKCPRCRSQRIAPPRFYLSRE